MLRQRKGKVKYCECIMDKVEEVSSIYAVLLSRIVYGRTFLDKIVINKNSLAAKVTYHTIISFSGCKIKKILRYTVMTCLKIYVM